MKKLLIVVDYQKDFVDGSIGFIGAEKLDDIIYNKINQYRFNGDDIIYTFDTHDQNYLNTLEGKNLPIVHCLKGSSGHQLFGKVATLFNPENDIYFQKETFPSLELANFLSKKNYQEVELCGLVSNICVLSNAIMVKSALPNVLISVDRNATASFDLKLNDYTMEILAGLHIKVIN